MRIKLSRVNNTFANPEEVAVDLLTYSPTAQATARSCPANVDSCHAPTICRCIMGTWDPPPQVFTIGTIEFCLDIRAHTYTLRIDHRIVGWVESKIQSSFEHEDYHHLVPYHGATYL